MNLQYHRDAAVQAQAFVLTYQNPKENIEHCLLQQAREQYHSNIHILEAIVKTVLYCGRQKISLRGHRDDWTSTASNQGNPIELLKLIAEFDGGIRIHLDAGKKNLMYTLRTIQNQVIDITGNMICKKITAHIKETDAFVSIIADEVTEKHSNREIISLCLRFVL